MTFRTRLHAIEEWGMRKYYSVQDRVFEKWHGIETGGVIENSFLASDHRELVKHATAYQAVWSRNVKALIEIAQEIADPPLFIDIGSGKGKACFYASKAFERVMGIEFSKELVDVAERNKCSFRRKNIEFIVGDAGQYDLPDVQSLIFLFNPFDEIVMDRFIQRNIETIRRRDCLIAYANDRQRKILIEMGFDCVYRNHLRKLSLWRSFG